jgi:AmmeMemoRadiSam system protein A
VLLGAVEDSAFKNSVSYLGLLFTNQKLMDLEKENSLTEFEKKSLLTLSRRTIENALKEDKEKIPEFLLWPLLGEGVRSFFGAFVTLNKEGNLRGCIGDIVARRPLYELVQEVSIAAAYNDSRFSPVTKNEFADIDIDISILTPPRIVLKYTDIIIGKHGVILKKMVQGKAWKSAVFLPQVPVFLGWDLCKTLEQLSVKAGLDKDAWKQDCQFEVFEGFEIKE